MFNLLNRKKAAAIALTLAQLGACSVAVPMISAGAQASPTTRSMENLDRGVVAMKTEDGVFISWRRLGTEPAGTVFTLYRNKEKVTEGAITNYVDKNGSLGDNYTVVCNGTMSKSVPVWEDNYIEIPLADPPVCDTLNTNRQGVYYGSYAPGDGTYGDLDGDGEYEIVMLWNPSDAKDAASGGRTSKAYIDAYKLDGTFMWRIDMGWNIRSGAHDTQLCVADFDSDGRAELMVRTSDGTIDAEGNIIGDPAQAGEYEDSWAAKNGGKALQAPLYVTVFDGETGVALDTVDYEPNNIKGSTEVSLSFGDDFGNRSERYDATIAWLSPEYPSAVFGRGYYFGKNGRQRQGAAAYDFRNGKLTMRWFFDTEPGSKGYKAGNENYVGQGNHQLEAADVDGDGFDEVTTGALWYDHDGTILWSSQLEHGDVVHVGDFTPDNPGLETMTAKEDYSQGAEHFQYSNPVLSGMGIQNALGADLEVGEQVWGILLQDAKTGKILQVANGTKDTGRGLIANIGYGDTYYVMWGAAGTGYQDNFGNKLSDLSLSMNGRIYWDGDLQDELQDHKGAGKEISIQKWNDGTKQREELFVPEGTHSINSTKGNTNGQCDMFGDWREEFVSYVITGESKEQVPMSITGSFGKQIEVVADRPSYTYALRVYTTNIPTDYNFYTLSHDDVYRNSSGAYNNCYNQPPHISWYMNDHIKDSKYTTQPDCKITLVKNKYTAPVFNEASLPEAGAKPANTAAASNTETKADGITVKLNKRNLSFDVAPQIINDRTMVPLRAIFEAMGADVDWDEAARAVTSEKDGTTVKMTIDSDTMYVNDEEKALDSPATIVEDRTLVPVRAIAESFGAKVDWDGDTKTVTIDTAAAEESADAETTETAEAAPALAASTGYAAAEDVPDFGAAFAVEAITVNGSSYTYKYNDYTTHANDYDKMLINAGFTKAHGSTRNNVLYTKSGRVVNIIENNSAVTINIM